MSGLLGGFDNVMAGLSAEDVERASAASTPPTGEAGPEATASVAHASPPPAARVVDPRAMALAQRMLGIDPTPTPGERSVDDPEVATALRFIPVTGGSSVELYLGSPATLTIGRADDGAIYPDLQLVIDRAVVSRRHCQVVATPDGFGVIDLGAANATAVLRDGVLHPVDGSPLLLQPGDIISTVSGEIPMVHVEAARVEAANS